jgi:uncharacterized protein (TIGR00661 family)
MAKFLFIVQGEGRGHLTQAISMYELLTRQGHEVVAALVGSQKNQPVPSFFTSAFPAPTASFLSPSLVYGKGKSVKMYRTILTQMLQFPRFIPSFQKIQSAIATHKPDIVINFYDVLAGLYNQFYRPSVPFICVGHQYLLQHTEFECFNQHFFDRWLLNLNTQITALRARKKLALSFYQMSPDSSQDIAVVPPLIRQEVKDLVPQPGEYWLAYVTHYRLAEDIVAWQKDHPEVQIEAFWNHPEIKTTHRINDHLVFHPIHAQHFLQKLQGCAGLVSTAGFETIAEALWLGKPALMVPVPNHIEQQINAFDAQKVQAGVSSMDFDLEKLSDCIAQYQPNENFVEWQQKADQIIYDEIKPFITQHTVTYQLSRQRFPKRLLWNNREVSY